MIVILTDFGNTDIYTPVMKGVIKTINPNSDIITLSNSIQPQNIEEAAYIIGNTYSYFPNKTVFLCVVDPGVGTSRKAIALETENYFFVAPDNGLLSSIIQSESIINCVEISEDLYFKENISSTFHGRDVFAPAAALIDKYQDINSVGSTININELNYINILPEISSNKIIGKIIHIDSFGNAISNIPYKLLENKSIKDISISDLNFKRIWTTFSDVTIHEPLTYFGSFGYLEFAVRNGDFCNMYDCDYFTDVKIIFNGNS
jgi:S-adenosylmethionine hydrolase